MTGKLKAVMAEIISLIEKKKACSDVHQKDAITLRLHGLFMEYGEAITRIAAVHCPTTKEVY